MKIVFFVVLYLISFYSWADIFKSIDSQGNVIYSDTPSNKKAERIEIPDDTNQDQSSSAESSESAKSVMSTNSANMDAVKTANVNPVKEKKPYTKFFILSPPDQATLQNQPIIYVDITIDPLLQEGDKIQIYLDGRPWGSASASTHFELTRPDRGTHQISARLIDDKQRIVKETGSYTIYVHQTHI